MIQNARNKDSTSSKGDWRQGGEEEHILPFEHQNWKKKQL